MPWQYYNSNSKEGVTKEDLEKFRSENSADVQ